jgi:DNA-binding transcriptional ArsR family regulator
VLRYELEIGDLAMLRFALSPLNETIRSLRAVFQPSRFPALSGWSEYARRAARRTNQPVLRGLLNDRLWTPDCLTPRPESASPKIQRQLRALRLIDPQLLRTQLIEHHNGLPRPLNVPDAQLVGLVVDAIEEYWSVVVSPHWDRLHRTLESDIAHRGARVASAGLGTALNEISPSIAYSDGVVLASGPVDRCEAVGGAGLVLVPSMFSSRVAMPRHAGAPMLLYAARGQGTTWERFSGEQRSLGKLIGKRRAELLDLLGAPASTTQIAAQLGISVPAVNQHLRALQSAGLLLSYRHGRSVLYRRTTVADALARGRNDMD